MNNKRGRKMKDEAKIELKYLFELLSPNLKWIVFTAMLFAGLVYTYSTYFITPLYTTDVSIYVNNKKYISSAVNEARKEDITTSESLVPTYISILKSRSVIKKVIDIANLNYSVNAVKGMIATSAQEETGIFKVYVKNTSPENATVLADTIAGVVTDEISNYVEGTSARVIDYAETPTSPSSPNVGKNTAIGFLVGMILSVLVIFLIDLFDVRIKTEADLINAVNVPLLGTIPELDKTGEGMGYYSNKNTSKGGDHV